MSTTRHVAIGIDFILRTEDASVLFVDAKTKEPLTNEQAKAHAAICKAKGYEVVPPCDNYDSRGFCLGHFKETA